MGIIHLLSRLKKTLYSIFSLCSLAWITTALTFGLRSSTEENTHKNSDDEELRDELRRIRDINTSSINKLYRFEEKIENLETDFSGEKELWRTKFQELFVDQQILKEQQQQYVHLEETTSENLCPQNADATDGLVESNVDVRDGMHRRLGEQVKTEHGKSWAYVNEYTSLEEPPSLKYSSLPTSCSSVFYHDGTNAQKAFKCFRVFVPRSPLDLNIGSRVKILLPSGKVGTGIVYKVGHLPGKDELQVGVDLESQECWQHLSTFKVQCKFHSDPPSGVQVPFSKVLMVWE
ncbi:uncharacterized protein LOC120993403 [Bufo bufo]|uniref:uncharacterized protein LOC120993403 n=1 Tax=Bufo bufo TaxID=8384 RepID=UPI001ABDCF7B|nr:uncharacterized protein LOC120993403 [Bufo bufo]